MNLIQREEWAITAADRAVDQNDAIIAVDGCRGQRLKHRIVTRRVKFGDLGDGELLAVKRSGVRGEALNAVADFRVLDPVGPDPDCAGVDHRLHVRRLLENRFDQTEGRIDRLLLGIGDNGNGLGLSSQEAPGDDERRCERLTVSARPAEHYRAVAAVQGRPELFRFALSRYVDFVAAFG